MLKRIVVLGTAIFGLMAVPALAQQYPPEHGLDVSATGGCPGDSITVTAHTYQAGSSVVVKLASNDVQLGTTTADAEGNVALEVTIPEDPAPGAYDIVVTGIAPDGDEFDQHAAIEVLECPAPTPTTTEPAVAPPDLPVTGSNSTMTLVKIGVALAAVGGLLLALARRRRGAHLQHAA